MRYQSLIVNILAGGMLLVIGVWVSAIVSRWIDHIDRDIAKARRRFYASADE